LAVAVGVEADCAHAPHVPNEPPSFNLAAFQHWPFCFMGPPPTFSADAGTAAIRAAMAAAATVKRMMCLSLGISRLDVSGAYRLPI
jgi:hypothetical protein